jgi:hypothetical protein
MILAAASMQLASAADAETAAPHFLDGSWEGMLNWAPSPTQPNPPAGMKVRLHLHGEKAEVFVLGEDGLWEETKPGQFKAFQYNFNAVIFATDSSQGGDCWDETWSFATAMDNANRLITRFSRVVSNVRCMKPAADSFGAQAAGLMTQQPH